MFAKYKTLFGYIKGIVATHAQKPLDFYRSREKSVDGGLDKLSAILELIRGQMDENLFNGLKRIKEQRDYLAHGKRFGQTPAIDLKIEEIAEILDRVISEIEQ